jgi:glucose-6-phosphate-specific signal transduction histidine kinase
MRRDNIIEKLEVTVISLFFSFSVAYFVSLWAVSSAYAERGYRACGGEYLLIAAVFSIAYKAISQFFKYFRRMPWKRKM